MSFNYFCRVEIMEIISTSKYHTGSLLNALRSVISTRNVENFMCMYLKYCLPKVVGKHLKLVTNINEFTLTQKEVNSEINRQKKFCKSFLQKFNCNIIYNG